MRVLSDNATLEWLSERRIEVDAGGHLSFSGGEPGTDLFLAAPSTREAVTDLAVNLVGILHTGSEWLLWLKDFSIWSDDTDEVGWRMIDTFAQIAQQPKLDLDSSAMIFNPDETLSVKATLLVPILFMWDAYLVNGDGNTFLRLDHDNQSFVSTKKDSVVQEIQESQLKSWILRVSQRNGNRGRL